MFPRFFGLMKATTVFLAAALLTQGITAGQLLSNADGGQLHRTTGGVLAFALVLQAIAALLVWRVGHGSGRYPAVTALLFVFVGIQFMVDGNVAVHVPLGVALFGAGAVLTARVWTTPPGNAG
ncbi:hypothetical protein [Actinomadura mexicana]|uniref:hypothetical protein n=1 Tax=Actinomadura mexicana TaxID=134959 RepID=UPI0011783EA5|nr:hypothetical protein [Actinomadura mexicana]